MHRSGEMGEGGKGVFLILKTTTAASFSTEWNARELRRKVAGNAVEYRAAGCHELI